MNLAGRIFELLPLTLNWRQKFWQGREKVTFIQLGKTFLRLSDFFKRIKYRFLIAKDGAWLGVLVLVQL